MKKRGRKAQTFIFIIVAIVIIALIVVIFYLNKGSSQSTIDKEYFSSASIKPDVNLIHSSIQDCMDDTSKTALDIIGIQGGYYDKPPYFFDLSWGFIPYYYYQGLFLMPSKQDVEEELGKYVDRNLNACLDELEFNNFKLSYKESKTSVAIRSKEVGFVIDMPVYIEREGKRIILELKEIQIDHSSYLNEILEVAKYITDSHLESDSLLCVNCVVEMAEERDVYVDLLDFEDPSNTLVMITENKTRTEPYIFEFLNKYIIE